MFLYTNGEAVYAAENRDEYSISNIEEVANSESATFVNNFLENAGDNPINVLNSDSIKVENETAEEILKLIQEQSLEEAVFMLRQNEYQLNYFTEERSVTSLSDQAEFSPMNVSNQVTRTEYFSHFPRDNSDRITGSWLSQLSMTYTENFDGTFTAMGSPSIRVETSFGQAFDPTVSNYSTGFSYTSGNRGIDYYGSYDVSATLTGPITIGGVALPLGTYNFGRTTDTFNLR